ncbi:rhamnulokinase [Leucobacter japonicus]|uniref:rhamnulokinase n=1 Tax=Leucobacter japonicus TaxID=1461259 RepID=UPI0006A7B95F|nr:FGGY-family carbohydrate kinase [Leucobacter japonicus]
MQSIAATDGPFAYVAVDLGASSGRVVLGVCDAGVWSFTETHRFDNGVLATDAGEAWDVERLFRESCTGLREAARLGAALGAEIRSIGVDSWGVDWALIDGAGEVQLPVLSYRGAPNATEIIATRSLDARAVYERSGIPDHPINTSLRLGARSRTEDLAGYRLVFIPDLWAYWLTGTVGTDPTIASTSQLLHAGGAEFSPELAAAVGIGDLEFPAVARIGDPAGALTEQAARDTDLSTRVIVRRVAGHDTAAAFAFADAAGSRGREVLISSGTWSLIGAAVDAPVTSEAARLGGFSNERGADGTLLLRNLTGLWTLQECLREWGDPDLAELLNEVRTHDFDARTFDTSDPVLFPSGPMEHRVRALCASVGRPVADGRGPVVHAIVDSLASDYATGVRAVVALTGVQPERIRMVGGGSRNDRLCRLTAELTGVPVVAGPTEATAIGNIAIQAAADGVVVHPADVFEALDATQIHRYSPVVAPQTASAPLPASAPAHVGVEETHA